MSKSKYDKVTPKKERLGFFDKIAKRLVLRRFDKAIRKAYKEKRLVFGDNLVTYKGESGEQFIGSADYISRLIFNINVFKNESNAQAIFWAKITSEDVRVIIEKIGNKNKKDGG